MNKFLQIISFFLLLNSLLFSQEFFIKGLVQDKNIDKYLSFSSIRVLNTYIGTTSNKNGEYELKLPSGSYTLVASYIGYYSDTISITLNEDKNNVNFLLTQTEVEVPEIVVTQGVNPAIEVIINAIEKKKKRDTYIKSYVYNAYTKGIIRTQDDFNTKSNSMSLDVGINDTAQLKITGILENHSIGYIEKPDKQKEVIVARKQSSNFASSINTLTGGRLLQDFYEDKVNFLGRELPGPLAEKSYDYYYFLINEKIRQNDYTILEILMQPLDPSDPGFTGKIYIKDSTYDLVKLELQLNRAANTGGLFDSVFIFQQFEAFDDSIYMPIDFRLFTTLNVLSLAKIGLEINTILYDYQLNKDIDDKIFDKAILTVLPNSDKKDSTYWENSIKIPNTNEEVDAYKRIDSLSNIPFSFWDEFSILSNRISINENLSVSAPLSMYHFNRVEGHTLDFGVFLDEALDNRFESSFRTSYGFADKKTKFDFSGSYLFGDYRTYSVSLNAFKKLNTLFAVSDEYGEFTSTFLSLLTKYEFKDYFYSDGFDIKTEGEIFPVLKLGLGFNSRIDKSAKKNTNFAFFYKDRKYIENQSIYDTKINSASINFRLDFRDYIEDGQFRRRIGNQNGYAIFDGEITNSSKALLKSNLNFTRYELTGNFGLKTFNSAGITLYIKSIYTNGALPYQYMYAIPGVINLASYDESFRTLSINEVFGTNVVTLNFEHNFRDEIFRFFNVPYLKSWDIQVAAFFNAAYSNINNSSKNILPNVDVVELKHPFYEAGFNIGHILFPIKLDFAWRLNYRGKNNFVISLNTGIL